jgi:hypothetical protein
MHNELESSALNIETKIELHSILKTKNSFNKSSK